MKSVLTKLGLPTTARGWHSWVGMLFLFILMFIFVTGTLSVFSREIDWIVTAEQRVAVQPAGKGSFGAVYDAVDAAYPKARQLAILRPSGARFADQVTITSPGQGTSLVYVDPYEAKVQGAGTIYTIQRTLRELHRGLSSEDRKVQLLVALLAAPLAIMLVTSLMLHRHFYRSLLRFPRKGARRRAILSDLHRLIGAWSIVFMTVVVLTSTEFMIEILGFGPTFYPSYKVAPEAGVPALPEGFDGASLDLAVSKARDVYPGLDVSDIALPAEAGDPLAIRGALSAALVRTSANSVNFDPETLALRGAYRAETSGTPLRVFEAVRVIHYGSFGGLTTRILWLIFGLGESVLLALGALIFAERLTFMAERSDKMPSRSRTAHIWTGMGVGKWVGLVAVFAAAWWTLT